MTAIGTIFKYADDATANATIAELVVAGLRKKEREVVTVGWDGRSRAMLRYADELHLPDYARSIVKVTA